MNGLRRAWLAFYSLLLAAAAGGLIAMAWTGDKKLHIEFGDFDLEAFIISDGLHRWLFTALMGLIAVLGLLTLVLACLPSRSARKGMVILRQSDGGSVEVATATLESLVTDALESLPEISRASATIRLAGGAIDSELDLALEPSASIAGVTSLAGATTAQALRDQVGVTNVRRPRIRVSYDEITARPAGTVPPAAPAPAPPPPPPPPPTSPNEDSEPDA
jgi:hypothetical protein